MSRIALIFLTLALIFPAVGWAQGNSHQRLLDAMQSELNRSIQKLTLADYERPYFIGYQLVRHESNTLSVRYGSIYRRQQIWDGDLYVEVRVGDYAFDNTDDQAALFDFDIDQPFQASTNAPIGNDLAALKRSLWLLTDGQYKKALSDYHKKRGKSVYKQPENPIASFSKEAPSTFTGPEIAMAIDQKQWEAWLLKLSRIIASETGIAQSAIQLSTEKQSRYYVNSEGTRIADERTTIAITIDAEAFAEDGMILTNSRAFYAPSPPELPSWKELEGETREMVAELVKLRKAPILNPYTGPALLSPQAAGVLFHETVGHRLEGERQNNDEEGHTFKGRIGQKILPEFLDLVDDPTQAHYAGIPLNGFYRFDNEGVPAQRTQLVKDGVLKRFLLSRTPVEGFSSSNGHGRSAGSRKPMARMGNTWLISHHTVAHDTLKKKLIELVKKQGKPYGLIIDDIDGGSTNTSTYGYQAFKGIPRIVYRIFPDGREELVRGVELVGTPLASINKILVTGDRFEVYNGYCGAESGYVPVSTIAPALLLEELEIQRKKEGKGRAPILPAPR